MTELRRREPEVGTARAARMSRRVDLPAPDGPTTARIWAGWAERETLWRI